ncbi:camp-regulated phosphoprotein/endosulfine conserved region-domain-containing protein [Colletotrichum navitas]|uniref:mRNA stability protein n=1 Tax=Colletotrichum navitas TaxID=681940 RepID=A0AAD8PZQ1_9PEZI|nr:camp-regulated phosphoprotein/endosulfine conserved region-domain-containing protein [Colletotrichum navitas]KAK1593108.1 camp-regulated phosphoprotein/endosulfine conserved region-domain-containing protein [Colletotrichum navitas]
MNPLQKNKIDVSSLSPEEQRLFRLYGKLPSRSDHFAKHLKDRKYFDSGDYAMSKAGKGDSVDTGAVGSQHPVPENIPHLSSPVNNSSSSLNGNKHHGSIPSGAHAGSPVKEASFLNQETSAEEVEHKDKENNLPVDETAKMESIPIRR